MSYLDASVVDGTHSWHDGDNGGVRIRYTQSFDTELAVTGTAGPLTYGQSATYTATVTAPDDGGSHPAGWVTVTNGSGTELAMTAVDAGGAATFPSLPVEMGTNTFTFSFSPESGVYQPSQDSVELVMDKAPTVLENVAAGEVVLGSPVQISGTVTPILPADAGAVDPPTGNVTVDDGHGTSVSGPVAADGTFTIEFPWTLGNHLLLVTYDGDAHYLASGAEGAIGLIVDMERSGSRIVDVATTPVTLGDSVTLTGRVEPLETPVGPFERSASDPLPSGEVAISDGEGFDVSAVLEADGSFSTEYPWTLGTHDLTITYAGDSLYLPADPASAQVTMAKATPTVILTVTPTSAVEGASMQATVVVDPPASPARTLTSSRLPDAESAEPPMPTGQVQLMVGGRAQGDPTSIADGQATLALSGLPVGEHAVTAIYRGDALYEQAESTSTAVTVTAKPAPAAPTSGTATGAGKLAYTGTDGAMLQSLLATAVVTLWAGLTFVLVARRRRVQARRHLDG